jgi:hypothetical protein
MWEWRRAGMVYIGLVARRSGLINFIVTVTILDLVD